MHATLRLPQRSSAIGIAAILTLVLALAACAPSSIGAGHSSAKALPTGAGIVAHRPAKGPPGPGAVTITGSLGDFSFSPAVLTVTPGTTVTWTNTTGSPHTVTSDFNGTPVPFGSPVLQPSSGTFSFTFTVLGIYHYHCSIHPTMHGTIVVVAVG